MQRLEVSGAVRPIYGSLGVKRLIFMLCRRQKLSNLLQRDSSVITVTSTQVGGREFVIRFQARKRGSPVLQNVQTGSGAHLAYYRLFPMGYEAEAWISPPPSNDKVKNACRRMCTPR